MVYPKIEPYAQHQLPVSDLHTLHIEEYGNPEGLPAVHLHGGMQTIRSLIWFRRSCRRCVHQAQVAAPLLTTLSASTQRPTALFCKIFASRFPLPF